MNLQLGGGELETKGRNLEEWEERDAESPILLLFPSSLWTEVDSLEEK